MAISLSWRGGWADLCADQLGHLRHDEQHDALAAVDAPHAVRSLGAQPHCAGWGGEDSFGKAGKAGRTLGGRGGEVGSQGGRAWE